MENRLQKRVLKNLLAQVTHSSGNFLGYIQDISKFGLGFIGSGNLEVGDDVELLINVPQRKNMRIGGAITWKRRLPAVSKNQFHYGVKINSKAENYDEMVEQILKLSYERRGQPRFNEMIEVRNDDVFDLLEASTADISAGGLYIRSKRPMTVGANIELALIINSEQRPLYCLSEVITAFNTEEEENEYPYGAGVKIISFAGDDAQRFEEYIKQLTALYQFHWPDQGTQE